MTRTVRLQGLLAEAEQIAAKSEEAIERLSDVTQPTRAEATEYVAMWSELIAKDATAKS